MAYDQVEAKLRFDGLHELWKKLHDKVAGKLLTMEEYTAFAQEGKHLVDAYNEEVERYVKAFGHETPYPPTLELIIRTQQIIMCTGGHLIRARARLEDVAIGKAAFTEMLGTPPATKQKVWN